MQSLIILRKVEIAMKLESTGQKPIQKNLQQLAVIESNRTVNKQTSIKCRYYLYSDKLRAEDLLYSSRIHWGIKNKLHWILDMRFGEDKNRVRKADDTKNSRF